MAEETPFRNVSGQSYVQNYDFTPYASIRTLPVQDWVQQAISNAVYAADPSLQIRVQSGGQTASRDPRLKNAPGGWTGSPRHDEGGAADFSLVRNGEKLPVRGNEQLYQAVARNLAAQGVPGIGVDVSKGYIHAGGGSQAAWGYQGNSASSRYLPQSFVAAINEGRQLYSRGTGIPTPPGEIPNVVASQVDTTPQTRNVPRPQPRPTQRMVQGTGQAPTSAASRAFPTQNVTPRLAPQSDGIFAYTAPDMQPAQITPGMGSLTPDFFRPKPQVRLPELPPSNLASSRVVNASIERANAAVDPGLQAALARRVAQPGMVETSMARATNAVDPALQRALEARNAVGVGLPPATRSVPSVPVGMNGVGQMPEFAQFLSQFGPIAKSVPGPDAPPKDQARLMPGMRDVAAITSVPPVRPAPPIQVVPAVATQLATARPVIGFPTPVSQRPAQMQAQRAIGFPTPANIRPSMGMAQPPAPTMRVTVQGANSYTAPQPQTFAGTSSGRSYTAGQTYTMGGDTYVANPDGSFTNTRTGRRLAGSSGSQSSQRSSSGPAQSLV